MLNAKRPSRRQSPRRVLDSVQLIEKAKGMESDNNQYFQTYSGYEFVSRKGRSKKKRKPRTTQLADFKNSEDIQSESDMSNTVESVRDITLSDDISSEIEDVETNSNKDRSNSNNDTKLSRNNSKVATDAMVKTMPTYETGLEDKAKNEEIASPTETNEDKLHDKDETVTVDPKDQFTLINTRALTKHATTYELEKFEKKILIIFNQDTIDGYEESRVGTEKDVESLSKTFGGLGFDVCTHDDLTKEEIFKKLDALVESDLTDYGCIAVAVLTHGTNNGLLRAKDQQYSEIEIINMFKDHSTPRLVTKPKLFIIQACRGAKIQQGVPVFQAAKIRKDLDKEVEPYILPVESDLIILHSSYVGSPSHRDEENGTWFIQALCEKIETLAATEDLVSIMTEVKRQVAIDNQLEEYNRRTYEMDINKQMPVTTSTLIRKLYLRKFGDQGATETFVDKPRSPIATRQEVLESTAPVTPLLVQFGPCSCFLEHFSYLKNCLRYYIEEHPQDEAGQHLLEVADTFEGGVEFNTSKEKMSKAISRFLIKKARAGPYYKYLYFYK